MKPTLKYERPLWKGGYVVIGVDEVGRGAIAGPVVASAVALATNLEHGTKNPSATLGTSFEQIGIDDSKRLTARKREELAKIIKKRALAYGIGEAGVGTINSIGIKKATERAMRRAIKNLQFTLRPFGILRFHSGQELRAGFRSGQAIYNPSTRVTAVTVQASLGMTRENYFILVDGYPVKYLPGGLKNQKAIVRGDQKSISIAAASIIAKVYRDRLMRLLSKKYVHYGFFRHVGYGTLHHKKMLEKYGICEIHRTKFVTTFLSSKTFWQRGRCCLALD